MQPDASGSFVGDIWFGDPVRRTRGTHRWDGAKWTELPSEEEVLMGLLAEARQRVQTAEATIARQAAEIAGVKADDRYPYVYHDKGSWGRVGVSFAHDTDYVRVDMMLENGPGARWQVVEMTPDEAEQMALRLLERARTARAALTGGGGT